MCKANKKDTVSCLLFLAGESSPTSGLLLGSIHATAERESHSVLGLFLFGHLKHEIPMGDYKQMDDAPAGPLPPPFALSKLDSDTWPTILFVWAVWAIFCQSRQSNSASAHFQIPGVIT